MLASHSEREKSMIIFNILIIMTQNSRALKVSQIFFICSIPGNDSISWTLTFNFNYFISVSIIFIFITVTFYFIFIIVLTWIYSIYWLITSYRIYVTKLLFLTSTIINYELNSRNILLIVLRIGSFWVYILFLDNLISLVNWILWLILIV